MQAVFSFMDWIARQTWTDNQPGDVWMDFAGDPPPDYANFRLPRQQRAAALVDRILQGDKELNQSLQAWIENALGIDSDESTALLWEPPRALMTSVLPTLLRRLRKQWHCYSVNGTESEQDYQSNFHPLPDFIPANLFSDLNLPEVCVRTKQHRHTEADKRYEPMLLAMQSLAPGNVTRRFAVERANVSHWIPPRQLASGPQTLEVETFCTEFQDLGEFASWENGVYATWRCIRPAEYTTAIVPPEVRSTSRASLDWRTQILPYGDGAAYTLPDSWTWSPLVREVCFFLHNQHNYVNVRRFAVASIAEIRHVKYGDLSTRIDFCERNGRHPAAIGYLLPVDAIRFRISLPSFQLNTSDQNRSKVRAFRTAYFRHRVHNSDEIAAAANYFLRDRLCDIYLSALSWISMERRISLAQANEEIGATAARTAVESVLTTIFQSSAADLDESELGGDGEDTREVRIGKMHAAILNLLRDDRLYQALQLEARTLWEDPDPGWHAWATDRLRSTIGRALLQAVISLSPQFEQRDLLLDLDGGAPEQPVAREGSSVVDIWISEPTIGGAGVVEEVFRQYTANPRRFFQIAISSLDPSELEEVDTALLQLIPEIPTSTEGRAVVEAMRQSATLAEKEHALKALKDYLLACGLTPHHTLISAIANRLLRPGTSDATDELYAELVRILRSEEGRLGIELDTRVFAYSASSHPDIVARFNAIPEFAGMDSQWRYGAVYSLLWAHGGSTRSRGLFYQHPYGDQPQPDRELLLDYLLTGAPPVDIENTDWQSQVTSALGRSGTVRLRSRVELREQLQVSLLQVCTEPVEIGALLLYPAASRVRQDGSWIEITLQLREVV